MECNHCWQFRRVLINRMERAIKPSPCLSSNKDHKAKKYCALQKFATTIMFKYCIFIYKVCTQSYYRLGTSILYSCKEV